MAEKLNHAGFEFAKALVHKGKVVRVERDDWSEHQPSTEKENEFIRLHGFAEYAKWHLGIDDQKTEDTKARSSSLMATSRRSPLWSAFRRK